VTAGGLAGEGFWYSGAKGMFIGEVCDGEGRRRQE